MSVTPPVEASAVVSPAVCAAAPVAVAVPASRAAAIPSDRVVVRAIMRPVSLA
jgi:hypothetical protein